MSRRPDRRRTRLSTRLIVAVLVPLTALTAVAGTGAWQRYRETARVSAVDLGVARTSRALRLFASLVTEMVASGTLAVGHRNGLSAEQASTFIGVDLRRLLGGARAEWDQAVAEGAGAALGDELFRLARIRSDVDAGVADASTIRAFSLKVIGLAEDDWMREVDSLNRLAFEGSGASTVQLDVTAMADAAQAYSAAAAEVAAAGVLSVPGGFTVTEALHARQELAAAQALYQEATARLAGAMGPAGNNVWKRHVADDVDVIAFARYVDTLLQAPMPDSRAPTASEIAAAAGNVHSALIFQQRLELLVTATAMDLTSLAARLRGQADRDLRTYVAGLALIAVLSIAIAATIASGIVRPLRRLARRAVQLSSGAVDGEPLDRRGPHEVAVVSDALNETVANLRAVNAAAGALADADFDSPMLQSAVPGEIGQSLAKTVQRLSQSILANQELQRSLTASETRFRELAERSPDVIWRLSRRPRPHFDYLSPSFETLTGIPTRAATADLNVFLDALEPSGRSELIAAFVGSTLTPRFDIALRRPDGVPVVFEVQLTDVGHGVQGVARDVTEIRTLQARVAEQALRDPLTGLANRRLLDELVKAALRRAERDHQPVSVAFLDLDGFKAVNDTYGHDAGDDVLRETARRLQEVVRDGDQVARVGGDEFVILCETGSGDRADFVERIDRALGRPIDLGDGVSVVCRASIGVAEADPDERDPSVVIALADARMYAAKRARARAGADAIQMSRA